MKKLSMEQVKAEFLRWQRIRKGGRRTRAPLQLREMALSLRGDYSVEQICESLGIYRSYLRRWKSGRQVNPKNRKRSTRSKSLRSKYKAQGSFVEISRSIPSHSLRAESNATVTVEWQRPDGARMQMSGAWDAAQIERMTERFLMPMAGQSP